MKKIKNILLCLETKEKTYENHFSFKDKINKVYQSHLLT